MHLSKIASAAALVAVANAEVYVYTMSIYYKLGQKEAETVPVAVHHLGAYPGDSSFVISPKGEGESDDHPARFMLDKTTGTLKYQYPSSGSSNSVLPPVPASIVMGGRSQLASKYETLVFSDPRNEVHTFKGETVKIAQPYFTANFPTDRPRNSHPSGVLRMEVSAGFAVCTVAGDNVLVSLKSDKTPAGCVPASVFLREISVKPPVFVPPTDDSDEGFEK